MIIVEDKLNRKWKICIANWTDNTIVICRIESISPFYERSIIDGKINWKVELENGKMQTPLEIRHAAEIYLRNLAFV